jgi:hypothetical protein
MAVLLIALWIAGAAVIASANRANRKTSLRLTMIWVCAAWIAVGWWLWAPKPATSSIALAFTSAAGISVLGARWPGARAWQFVVIGLLGVTLLPLLEADLLGRPLTLSGVRIAFAIGLLGTGVLNYVPTRLGIAAALAGYGAGLMFADHQLRLARMAIAAAPVIGWLSVASRRSGETNTVRLWLDFRDRFGAIWSLRVLEQFNRSAANSGSTTTLKWNGLNGPDGPDSYERLRALLRRFGLPPT